MAAKPGHKLTPMMERYLEVKRQNPNAILLFRMGDFYELFHEDAETAAKVLGLTLTSRDKGSSNPVPMAGFPYHALENYLQKLIKAGFRAAICDQVEDPKKAKGLVKREVTRIVTPGTLTDDALLDPRASNFLAAVHFDKEQVGCAWLELSTGEFFTSTLEAGELLDELSRINPAECLIAENVFQQHEEIIKMLKLDRVTVTERPDWCFAVRECERILCEHFQTKTLEGFDLQSGTPAVTAAGALLDYIRETQKTSLGHINTIKVHSRNRSLQIDEATRRSLELTITLREGQRQGSLLDTIDRTVSPMGARLFANWLSNPLTEKTAIEQRLDSVEEFTKDPILRTDLRESLKQVYDLQRLTSRIATKRANARDFRSLSATLELLPSIKAKLTARKSEMLQNLEQQIDLCEDVRSEIEKTLVEEPPLLLSDGGAIKPGFHAQLDEYRGLAKGGKAWMASYQAKEMERTGISNLKIGFNRVFGYYLEVTAAHADKVPEEYIRKQTLKNQERYITPELKDYEEKVLRAEEQAVSLEQELFQQLRESVNRHCLRLQNTAMALAVLDVLSSLAELSVKTGYCRPELTDEPLLDIREGRHPVLDALQPTGPFVPNDVRLMLDDKDDSEKKLSQLQIITGPNMAGKSTYIRQAALLCVMAQMGSFIPASEARIGICDRIFARVGASDELGKGQSTFMVEMTETARILNSATNHSLVILDEIGRGTSTYDGISLAWAVTEYLHDKIGCRTLFATHYHELTELSQSLQRVTNWNVAVQENRDDVIFLHKIIEGTADKSYGIHVARLAGIPAEVIQRSRIILETLESDHLDESGKPKIPPRSKNTKSDRQLALFEQKTHPILDELREMDIDQMTPLSALQELHRLREVLGNKKNSS